LNSPTTCKEAGAAKLFVLAAPSGAGKTTLVNALVERNPGLRVSVSYTTRSQRVTEVEGRDYHFVTTEEFSRLRDAGELLESALVFDNFYGTSRAGVQEHLDQGHNVILEIDWQGARQVRQSMPGCVTIFILPPQRSELERRLRSRKTDSDEVIERRLRDALSDMSHWREFDYVIINDQLDQAVERVEAVLCGQGEEDRSDHSGVRARVARVVGA